MLQTMRTFELNEVFANGSHANLRYNVAPKMPPAGQCFSRRPAFGRLAALGERSKLTRCLISISLFHFFLLKTHFFTLTLFSFTSGRQGKVLQRDRAPTRAFFSRVPFAHSSLLLFHSFLSRSFRAIRPSGIERDPLYASCTNKLRVVYTHLSARPINTRASICRERPTCLPETTGDHPMLSLFDLQFECFANSALVYSPSVYEILRKKLFPKK